MFSFFSTFFPFGAVCCEPNVILTIMYNKMLRKELVDVSIRRLDIAQQTRSSSQ